MPTYEEVKNQYLSLQGQINTLVSTYNQDLDLGQSYTMVIKVETRDPPRLSYRLEAPGTKSLDINRVPDVVLHRFYTNGKALEDWKDGTISDFPVLISA